MSILPLTAATLLMVSAAFAARRAAMPHLFGLMKRPAWSLTALEVMPALSSPGWASMITGAGIEPDPITSHANTFDTAATLAWLFGLKPLECAIGRPVLAAFRPDPGQFVQTADTAPRGCPVNQTGARRIRPLAHTARADD